MSREEQSSSASSTHRPLHNFTLPSHLKWGHQKLLRCMRPSSDSPAHRSPPATVVDDDIKAVRQKLMTDIKAAADRMKNTILGDGDPPEAESPAARPWTLRSSIAAGKSNLPPPPPPPKIKFSLCLTKEEIDADFIAMTGAKPPRRSKKRPRALQKQIDDLFPGNYLSDVTPEKYSVTEIADQGRGDK